MVLRAILIDHDGTLVDSEPVHHQHWVHVLKDYGVTLTAEEYRQHHAGMPTPANAIDLCRRFNLTEDPARLASAKNDVTRAWLQHQAFPLQPGVPEALAFFCRHHMMLAVVTGAGAHGAQVTLARHGLIDCFATVVSGDDVEFSKPAPDVYLLAATRLGVDVSDCVAIEDTEHGLLAARRAQIPCLAVPTQFSAHHDFGGSEAVLTRIDEARAWVLRVLRASGPATRQRRVAPGSAR